MKRARHPVFLLMVVAATVAPFAVAAAQDWQGYTAKARFLIATPGFVEWPETTFKSRTAPLEICVYGEYPFGTTLAELARQEFVNGHRMEVKWVRKEKELAGCQVLFVTRSEAKRYEKDLEVVKNSATLTVGEDPEFLTAGGMIRLQPSQNGVQFDVNVDAVRDGHLKLSSQLLALARNIVHHTESARS